MAMRGLEEMVVIAVRPVCAKSRTFPVADFDSYTRSKE